MTQHQLYDFERYLRANETLKLLKLGVEGKRWRKKDICG
jgi:hypothetical protein